MPYHLSGQFKRSPYSNLNTKQELTDNTLVIETSDKLQSRVNG